jgi:hypothetical protein
MRIRLPRRPSRNSLIGQWANDLQDVIERIVPQAGPNEQVSRTTRGTFVIPDRGRGGGTPAAGIDWEDQWVDQPYPSGAIVIRALDSEMDDGNQAGTYIANSAVNKGDAPPGSSATAFATIAGGIITGITVSQAGTGYVSATAVIYGDGQAATADVTVQFGHVTHVNITNGGTGYTTSSVRILSPQHKWDTFATFNVRRFTMRNGLQRIVFDCGRDKTKPTIEVYNNYTDPSGGGVRLKLSDIPAGAGFKELFIHEDIFCVYGVGNKKALNLRSEFYD